LHLSLPFLPLSISLTAAAPCASDESSVSSTRQIEEAGREAPPPSSRLLARNATRDLGAAVAAEEERGDA